jgi:hypothetical protein
VSNKGGVPYPPSKRAKPKPPPIAPREYESWEQYEEQLFRAYSHFNVVRFGYYQGGEVCTVKTFPEALYISAQEPRALIYVVSESGAAFCMDRKDREKFGRLWMSIYKPGKEAQRDAAKEAP